MKNWQVLQYLQYYNITLLHLSRVSVLDDQFTDLIESMALFA